MITTKEQESLFTELSRKLRKRVTAYAIGGNAMIYWGFKDATVDVDLVFLEEGDRKEFASALKSLGYSLMDVSLVYTRETNRPVMLKRASDERFDLFLNKVIRFTFSEGMEKRSGKVFEYGEKLVIRVADYHDIILMKCSTDRARDKEDIRHIINEERIEWDIIIDEARNQIILGNGGAVFDILQECLVMKNEMGLDIPEHFFERVWDLFSEQDMVRGKGTKDKNPINRK
jgi:hypothetical protein